MCGRYALFSDQSVIETEFDAPFKADNAYTPSWNIPPGTFNPIALLGKAREPGIIPMRWGLVPHFAEDDKIGFKMINARSETIEQKPSFKKPFQRKRCLIPANGFYEWKKLEGSDIKIPFYITLMDKELFGFAGIFDHWKTPEDEDLFTYSIITTEANTLLQPLHERMPVIVEPKNYGLWLDPMNNDAEGLKNLLKPYPTENMRAFRIRDLVNKPSNNSPELIEPIV